MRRHTSPKSTAFTLLTLVVVAALGFVPVAAAPRKSLDRINHVIVIYYENWSFDGLFPGANGIANAGATVKQVTLVRTKLFTAEDAGARRRVKRAARSSAWC